MYVCVHMRNIIFKSIRCYRMLCQCKSNATTTAKLKMCLNSTVIFQTPSAFSFILFWFWSVRNHISIKYHLVLIQTEQPRHSGCTSWLGWPRPRVKTNPYKSPDVSNWIVINLINWTAFQSLLYCFNPSGFFKKGNLQFVFKDRIWPEGYILKAVDTLDSHW